MIPEDYDDAKNLKIAIQILHFFDYFNQKSITSF